MTSSWRQYERPFGVILDTQGGRRLFGQMTLKRGGLFDSNVVSMADTKPLAVDRGASLHGISPAGKVSLLECVRPSVGMTAWRDFAVHHGDLAFRYAVFGRGFVSREEKCVWGIQFVLEGMKSSVFRFDEDDSFGVVDDLNPDILKAIEKDQSDRMVVKLESGAMFSYFTGKWDYLSRFTTALGRVHVTRSMTVGVPESSTPHLVIGFDNEPVTLEDAWEKMREVRHFFSWMMGYAPRWREVKVFTSRPKDDGTWSGGEGMLDVFGPNEWTETSGGGSQYQALIDGSVDPDYLASVMQAWLERNGDGRRRRANLSFFGSLWRAPTIEDGIVAAANAFDLIPSEDKPDIQPLPSDVAEVLENTKKEVKSLISMDEAQREDVLNALARIRGNRRLRDVVEHRARAVVKHFRTDELKGLEDVIRLAVACRNYYTHGSSGKTGAVDFSDPGVVSFLTDTLRFVYGASELLDCGWNPAKVPYLAFRHPLMSYVKDYDERVAVLGSIKG